MTTIALDKLQERKRRMVHAVLDEAGSRFVSITFFKKDGTERTLTTCNTATVGIKGDDALPSAQQAVETRRENFPNYLNRYDIHKKGWRTVNIDTISEMKVDGIGTSWPVFHKTNG